MSMKRAKNIKSYVIHFRGFGGECVTSAVINDNALYPLTRQWTGAISNRQRLNRARMEELVEELPSLLFGSRREDAVTRLAAMRVIQVEIPWLGESHGWAARVFPWEDALSIVTKPLRPAHSITVVRRLLLPGKPKAPPGGQPARMLVVNSAPGVVGEMFSLAEESARMRAMLGTAESSALETPTANELKKAIENLMPEVVHLAGVDLHQAGELGVSLPEDRSNMDGYLLAGAGGRRYHGALSKEVAELLTAASRKPWLVTMNLYFSAARSAALCVQSGAHFAIGFHDTAQDNRAEEFFARFYSEWRGGGGGLPLDAFQKAVEVFRNTKRREAGVVLWTRHSLVDAAAVGRPAVPQAREESRAVVSEADIRRVVSIKAAGIRRLNFAMLHNDRPVMEAFRISLTEPCRPPMIKVEVVLHAGGQEFPWRQSVALTEHKTSVDLVDDIRPALVSRLLRECRESLWSSLYACVTCGEHLLMQETWRVELLSADEWRNTEEDRRWLPSFVFPRDKSVTKLKKAAEIMLKAVMDDRAASFDGYQVFDRMKKGPAREAVDMQVRAVWAAIQHLMPLSYINPPSSYDPLGQRIRTPSQCYDGGSATCIDLTTLLAAVLEDIGIYPVIFLIDGHAFPGYWRDPEAWEELTSLQSEEGAEGENAATASMTDVLAPRNAVAPWIFAKAFLRRVKHHWRQGGLVALESTLVTSAESFAEAVSSGIENLADERDFVCMVDIQSARTAVPPVMPLPLSSPHFNPPS